MRVLLIKTSSMGDLVHTHSALIEALKMHPGLRVDWVCEEAFVDIPPLCDAVDQVIPVAIRRWRHHWTSPTTYAEIRRFTHRLRSRSYDVVIDAQGLLKSAWIASLARCPSGVRVGFDWSSSRESLASLAYRRRVRAPAQWHAIERLRVLFAQALGYATRGGIAWRASTDSLALTDGFLMTGREVFFLHGTSRSEKSWASEQWVALGRELVHRGQPIMLPTGSEVEHRHAVAMAQAIGPQAHVLGATSIAGLSAMITRSAGAIGVDSGLMHLSVLLGKPTVAVMSAAADPRFSASRFGPAWAPHARVVIPSSQESGIDMSMVLRAWDELQPGRPLPEGL
jgi:heptosyltransferase-1